MNFTEVLLEPHRVISSLTGGTHITLCSTSARPRTQLSSFVLDLQQPHRVVGGLAGGAHIALRSLHLRLVGRHSRCLRPAALRSRSLLVGGVTLCAWSQKTDAKEANPGCEC